MKAANPYNEPTPGQVRALCSLLSEKIKLPDKVLAQYLINCPGILEAKLASICYYPVRVARTKNDVEGTVFANLNLDGLVAYSPTPADWYDLIIIGCFTPFDVERAREKAKDGVIVIAKVIKEDKNMFDGTENIFTYADDCFSVVQLERFIRDVLFQTRDRFYYGPVD